jgi:hypothetical protein
MEIKEGKKRLFNGMDYREVQRSNSKLRIKLDTTDQKWLKNNNYRNSGWNNVVKLYQKIENFLDQYKINDFTLEELFLEADRIGNKYLSGEEIKNFNQKMSQEVNEIADLIDKHFPDTEIEFVDFSKQENNNFNRNRNQDPRRTISL